MTFSRRLRAVAANSRVSETRTPSSSTSSSVSSTHFGRSTPSAAGATSASVRPIACLVALVLQRHVAQEARPEGDVAVLVAGDVDEAFDEGRQRADAFVVGDDEVLAGERKHPLDHHVVDRDGLDQRLGVLGLAREPVDAPAQQLVEQLPELGVEVLAGLGEAPPRSSASSTPTSE